MIIVTPLYAGLLALLFIALSLQVISARRELRVSVGDGGEKLVIKRMRAQANCAEYAPLGIILLALADLQAMPVWSLHVLGLTLLAGRVLHAHGFGSTPQVIWARVWGMYLTFAAITVLALANIALALL
jgi:hypothetical protein